MTSVLDVVVVGGGQAGLAMGYHLRARGGSFAILEAGGAVGHTWRSRWDSLRLFTPARYAGLPGMPFPGPPDGYPAKDQVADYLVEYAAAFDLPIRLDTTVTAMVRDADGFALSTSTGQLRARQVVVATGPFQVPVVPPVAAGLADDVVAVHSSCYRNFRQLPDGHVLVVGGGNSGFQIAAELAAARRVTLAVGTRNAAVPQRPLGRDVFWWQTALGLITAPADSRRGRWMRRGEGTVIGTTTRQLRRAGVTLRSRLLGADGHQARFADGHTLAVAAVLWATGYRRDHSWIAIPGALDEHGRLLHRGGVTPVPGLFVLGQPWQRISGSALLGYVGQDAEYLAARLG
ncbi:MAG: NAD(P)/FAD-dependent oxidoreductase [Pseudonocardiaceae bacterium]|nr:NAD(P)/FAD-dependent oxidoreductase [Pseudonocardiaceae bacterium]